MDSQTLPVGTIVKSRFEIVRRLGEGTFGRTYLAKDQDRFDAKCTLKQLRLDQAIDEDILSRQFLREAKQLNSLGKRSSIPEFLGYFNDSGQYFLAYEYIDGVDLSTLVAAGHQWQAPELSGLWLQIADTLKYIHKKGIVHRDIKPSNIIANSHTTGYSLIDFGASIRGPWGQGTLIGTPGYSPLQQLAHGIAGPNSDMHALAMTLIHLLTAKTPASLYSEYGIDLRGRWRSSIKVHGMEEYFLSQIDESLIDEYSDPGLTGCKGTSQSTLNEPINPSSDDPVTLQVCSEQIAGTRSPDSTIAAQAYSIESNTQNARNEASRPTDLTSVQQSRLTAGSGIGNGAHSLNDDQLQGTLHLRKRRTLGIISMGLLVSGIFLGIRPLTDRLCEGHWYCVTMGSFEQEPKKHKADPALESDLNQAIELAIKARNEGGTAELLRAKQRLESLRVRITPKHDLTIRTRLEEEANKLSERLTPSAVLEYTELVISRSNTLAKKPRDVVGKDLFPILVKELKSISAHDSQYKTASLMLSKLNSSDHTTAAPRPSSYNRQEGMPDLKHPSSPTFSAPDPHQSPQQRPADRIPIVESTLKQPPPSETKPPSIYVEPMPGDNF